MVYAAYTGRINVQDELQKYVHSCRSSLRHASFQFLPARTQEKKSKTAGMTVGLKCQNRNRISLTQSRSPTHCVKKYRSHSAV